MERLYDFVTFDCYGTLVDWDEGIGSALERMAEDAGARVSRDALLAAYTEIEPIVEAGPYRSYREVLKETARRAAGRFEWTLGDNQANQLPDSIGDWPPFPDTATALSRLVAAGYRLGILSNVDTELLVRTLRHFDVEFELIVTAQDVGAYKPTPAHFLTARRRLEGAPWLHAAQSWFHDVVPASELGIPVAWINRKSETPGDQGRADRELSTLADLADWLAP